MKKILPTRLERRASTHSLALEQSTLPPAEIKVPDWILPFQVPSKSGLPIGLSGDLELASDSHLRDPSRVWPLRLHDRDNAAAVSSLAREAPGLFLDIVLDRLRRLDPTQAVLVDMDDPATRVFERACRMLGVIRIYAPAHRLDLPYGSSESDRIPDNLRPGFCDFALIWTLSQKERLISNGVSQDALVDVAPPDIPEYRPRTESATVLIWLSRIDFWPKLDALTQFGQGFIKTAEQVGFKVAFLFDFDMTQRVPKKLYTSIYLSDAASLRIIPHPADPLGPTIEGIDVVVTDRDRNALRAAATGIPHLDLCRALLKEAAVVSGKQLRKKISSAVMRYFDGEVEPNDSKPIETAFETALPALQRLTNTSGSRARGVIEDIIAGCDRDIGVALSAIPEATLERENRHIATLLGVRDLRLVTHTVSLLEVMDADLIVQWGLRHSENKTALSLACKRVGSDFLILEDGFVRSIEIGLQGSPTCSIVIDDMGVFYDATRPSRLETILNGETELDSGQRERAIRAMALITETKVSKYNFAPYRKILRPAVGRKAVLIIDQRAGDMSIKLGMASQVSFEAMLAEAMALSYDHDIWIKTHPDATLGGRESAIGAKALYAAAKHANVTIISEETNPYSLLEDVDKVFVVTSGMGFEALMAGKEVHCFGMPFYAGWGLTQDRLSLPRRCRDRSLADVFYTFYLTLSRYVEPETGSRCELEDLVRRITEIRPWQLSADTSPAPVEPSH